MMDNGFTRPDNSVIAIMMHMLAYQRKSYSLSARTNKS